MAKTFAWSVIFIWASISATDGNLLMTAANFARFFPAVAGGGDPLRRSIWESFGWSPARIDRRCSINCGERCRRMSSR